MQVRFKMIQLMLLLALAVLTSGCSNTRQAITVIPSGFLQDYSLLEKGEGDETLYQYWHPGVQWERYHKVIVDPVVIIMSENSQLNNIMQSERERLRELLGRRIREALKRDFHVVVKSGPNVLRIRAAITEAQASTKTVDVNSVLDTAKNTITSAGKLVMGNYNLISSTSIEGEILNTVNY